MNLETAHTWASCAAALAAVAVGAKRPAHRPLAALVLLGCLSYPLVTTVRDGVVLPAQAAIRLAGGDPLVVPLTGWPRVAGHLLQAAALSWGPAVAAACAVVFGWRWGAWLSAAVWCAALTLLVVCYHHVRGHAAAPVYLFVDLAALVLAVRAFLAWAKPWANERPSPESHHAAALCCLVFQGFALLVYRHGLWGGVWDVARFFYVLLFLGLLLIEGVTLWNMTSPCTR